MEYRYLHKNGHIVWVLDQAALLTRDGSGRPKLFQGVMMDITDRKEAQSLVRETALRYRSLAEQVNAIIYVTDLSRRQTMYVGPQLETMLGHTTDDWRTIEGWLSCVHPDDREHVTNVLRHVGETAEPYVLEYRVLHKDGSVRWLRDQGSAVSRDAAGRPIEIQGLLIDITSTRRAEQEREEAAALYRSLIEQIPAATYIELPGSAPGQTHLVYLSPQIEAIFGRTAEDLLADPEHFAKMLHPEDRERVLAADDEASRTGEPFDAEFRIVRPDGTIARVHSRAALVNGEDGTPLFWHGVTIDVTAQRETEAALRELEARVLLLSDPDELHDSPGPRGTLDGERTAQGRGASSRRRSGR
jgi:PAS domain S-box-containing protein